MHETVNLVGFNSVQPPVLQILVQQPGFFADFSRYPSPVLHYVQFTITLALSSHLLMSLLCFVSLSTPEGSF